MVKVPLWETSTGALSALIASGQFVQADLVTIQFRTPVRVGLSTGTST